MDKIEKIRQEIKQLRREVDDHNYYLDNSEQALGYSAALNDIEKFLDTLSEEPDKSLKEAAEEYIKKGRYLPEAFFVRPAFIAGAEWQKSQTPMPEDTALFNKGVAEGRRLEREDVMKDAVDIKITRDTLYTLKPFILEKYLEYKIGKTAKLLLIQEDEK